MASISFDVRRGKRKAAQNVPDTIEHILNCVVFGTPLPPSVFPLPRIPTSVL